MKKLVLAMVALLAIFTFIREYSGSRPETLDGFAKAQAAPSLANPSLANPSLANPALANPATASPSVADPLVKIDR